MQDLTRTDLLQITPARYLKAGYVTGGGKPRALLTSIFATAVGTQLLEAELAPQELAYTAEAIRQLLPVCAGAPGPRLASAIRQSRPVLQRMLGQSCNQGLATWLDACAGRVIETADLVAFLAHLLAVQRQYALMASITPVREAP